MPHTDTKARRPAVAAIPLALSCLLLGACGGSSKSSSAGATVATTRTTLTPQVRAFTSFATCMRAHGVRLPPPNTSGKGPVFDLRGLNPNAAAFKAAARSCRNTLRGALPANPKLLPHRGSGGTQTLPGQAPSAN